MNRRHRLILTMLIAAGTAASAAAQIGVPGLPPLPLPVPEVLDPVTGTLRTAQSTLTEVRKLRIRELLRGERATVETDPDGQPILRGQVGALSPTAEALERAKAAGFTILSDQALEGLGFRLVVLRAPNGISTRRALKKLRSLDPGGSYDYNHLYLDSGAEAAAALTPVPATQAEHAAGPFTSARIGLIDTGIDRSHPALAGAAIRAHGCDGKSTPATHGTAVASLLVGSEGDFRGVVQGATLYASDIFCGHPAGSLSLLAVELDWMARERVPVVNISLVGAKSVLLTGLVRAMGQRGHLMVAAVGNDGPAAPPLYPAAYPEVVGVTGVDAGDQVLPEACRGEHVDYAAPGSNFYAAQLGGGFNQIRGTSFATPVIAGMLARTLTEPDPARAAAALEQLTANAVDLGRKGVDTTYGRGLVGAGFRPGWVSSPKP